MYLEEILANCDNLKKETLTITPEYSEKLKFWNGEAAQYSMYAVAVH